MTKIELIDFIFNSYDRLIANRISLSTVYSGMEIKVVFDIYAEKCVGNEAQNLSGVHIQFMQVAIEGGISFEKVFFAINRSMLPLLLEIVGENNVKHKLKYNNNYFALTETHKEYFEEMYYSWQRRKAIDEILESL